MSDEAREWLRYAEENLRAAFLCLGDRLYNPALQNAQQTVEKALKAVCLRQGLAIKRTHSVGELVRMLGRSGAQTLLTDDECALLDSIYLPSKYPLGSLLPHFEPDQAIAERCIALADRTLREAFAMVEPA